jgi:hypothetical protein
VGPIRDTVKQHLSVKYQSLFNAANGSPEGILLTFEDLFQKISPITKKHVLIGFSLPKESSLAHPSLNRFSSNFSEQEFKKALNNHFPNNKNLGRCNYRSGNAYRRYMYYGTK